MFSFGILQKNMFPPAVVWSRKYYVSLDYYKMYVSSWQMVKIMFLIKMQKIQNICFLLDYYKAVCFPLVNTRNPIESQKYVSTWKSYQYHKKYVSSWKSYGIIKVCFLLEILSNHQKYVSTWQIIKKHYVSNHKVNQIIKTNQKKIDLKNLLIERNKK